MKKKRTIVSLTRGVRPELREKGIKIDKAGRARRGGKFLTLAAVARAVTSLKKKPARKTTSRPPRETARERELRERLKRAEALVVTQQAEIARRDRETKELHARMKRTQAAEKKDAAAKARAERARVKAAQATAKKATKELSAVRTRQSQTEKRLKEVEAAIARAPAPPPATPAKPPKGKPAKPPKGGKKKKKRPALPPDLTDEDAIILASWDNLATDEQYAARQRLSPAGRAELDRRQRAAAGAPLPVGVTAAKSPEQLHADLQTALRRKGVKRLIAEEVNNSSVRKKPVQAWEDQHRATMRHPNMIVQTDKDAIKAANKGKYPKREKGTRYHATIIAITQHPPLEKYGPTSLLGNEDLFVMYVSAQGASSRAGIKRNVTAAIRTLLSQLPGGAPAFIAAIEVRTTRKRGGK